MTLDLDFWKARAERYEKMHGDLFDSYLQLAVDAKRLLDERKAACIDTALQRDATLLHRGILNM